MFIIGEEDDMVKYTRFQKMFDECGSDRKKLRIEPGAGHPDSRTEETLVQAFAFMGMDIEDEEEEEIGEGSVKNDFEAKLEAESDEESEFERVDMPEKPKQKKGSFQTFMIN